MAGQEKIIDTTMLGYYHQQVNPASKTELQALDDKVDEIISEGGEPNVIETVKVNGTALIPDAQKAVNIVVPTKTSDLTNDGDGTSNFATESYVDTNGGKIDKIKVNGTAQTITNKEVDITVPTKVSDITNDSGFQTSAEVGTAISTALANSGDAYQTESDVQSLIDSAISSVYVYKGTVASVSNLPASGNKVGDAYNVEDTGMNYAWDGTKWDDLGGTIDLSNYWDKTTYTIATASDIDAILNA